MSKIPPNEIGPVSREALARRLAHEAHNANYWHKLCSKTLDQRIEATTELAERTKEVTKHENILACFALAIMLSFLTVGIDAIVSGGGSTIPAWIYFGFPSVVTIAATLYNLDTE